MKRYALVSRFLAFGFVLSAMLLSLPAQVKAAKVGYSLPGQTNFNISLRDAFVDLNTPPRPPRKVHKVILDAGHGGKDTGCSGKNSKEKDIALDITMRVGQMIKNNFDDVEVIYTRDRDEFIPLHERANMANKSNADLFISIHCNTSAKRNSATGTETFVLGLHRAEDNLSVAKRENSVISQEQDFEENYGGYDPNSDEGHITLSMYQNAFLDQSIAFANFIEEEFQNHGNRVSRGVKQAGFLVLRNTVMPSVLVETGFLNHNKEETFLKSEAGKGKIASSIFNAFSKYKYDIDHMVAMHGDSDDKIEAIPASYTESGVSKSSGELLANTGYENTADLDKDVSINYVERAKLEMARMTSQGSTNASQSPTPSAKNSPQIIEDSPPQTEEPKPPSNDRVVRRESPTSDRSSEAPAQELRPTKKKLAYVVQLSASNRKLRSGGGKWDKVQNEIMIRFENDLYKYQVGELASYDEALTKKTALRNLGFKDCFIVAYYDDAQINIKDAVRLGE